MDKNEILIKIYFFCLIQKIQTMYSILFWFWSYTTLNIFYFFEYWKKYQVTWFVFNEFFFIENQLCVILFDMLLSDFRFESLKSKLAPIKKLFKNVNWKNENLIIYQISITH